jgi:heat shock protein HtpX
VPITFVEIERAKSWRIAVLFCALFLLYLLFSLLTYFALFCFYFWHWGTLFTVSPLVRLASILVIILIALGVASFHFYRSMHDVTSRIMTGVDAQPPDPDDQVHKKLINIAEEVHIAAGQKRRIEVAVIPDVDMNALSAVGLHGRALIAVTEGLLSRLSREQVEAVIAHEAYHILSGDCFQSTVAASLFGAMAGAAQEGKEDDDGGRKVSAATPAALLFMAMTYLLNLFISREREYRADAGAVRMTRAPLALAEALYMVSQDSGNSSLISSGWSALCIVHPGGRALEETEGLLADLFSTHPPIEKRILLLLDMAGAGVDELISGLREGQDQRTPAPESRFLSSEIADGLGSTSRYLCPKCNVPLREMRYEKTRIYTCAQCGGRLLDQDRIVRILARTNHTYPKEIRERAGKVMSENQKRLVGRGTRLPNQADVLLSCPRCGEKMQKTFSRFAFLIEVDRCFRCNFVWFDPKELEMLQSVVGAPPLDV